MLIRIDCAPAFAVGTSGGSSPAEAQGGWLEWGVVEFQGELLGLDLRPGGEEQEIGEIIDVKGDTVTMALGQHLLEGTMMDLSKPYLVVEVPPSSHPATAAAQAEAAGSGESHVDDAGPPPAESEDNQKVITVQGIVKKRLLFKTRPKPRGNL